MLSRSVAFLSVFLAILFICFAVAPPGSERGAQAAEVAFDVLEYNLDTAAPMTDIENSIFIGGDGLREFNIALIANLNRPNVYAIREDSLRVFNGEKRPGRHSDYG